MASTRPAAPAASDALALTNLRATVNGSVIMPGEDGYEEARATHNLAIDRRPAVVVRAADASDVARGVTFARRHGLELEVKSGGHGGARHGIEDGGLLLDLSRMKGLHIDPDRRLAWAQPGLTAGEYTVAAAAHGLATSFGDTASVGLGGLTLGGGIGWLTRKYGMTIDALVSVELVTADGRLIRASADENSDLFWAIRGGGGNFGVVTRFQFRLYPVSMILGGALFLPPTREVLRGLVPTAKAAPEELTTISFLMPAPPLPFVPVEQHGKLTLITMFVYDGDVESGQAALAPFRALAEPYGELVAPMPYPGIYQLTEAASQPSYTAHRSMFLDELDDAQVDAILERVSAVDQPPVMTEIRVLGGAMARVPAEDTAFAHRDKPVMVVLVSPYEAPEQAAAVEAATQSYFETLRRGESGVYVNFLDDEGEARIREAYPTGTYERLAEIKRRYDPTNFFHANQNVRPAEAEIESALA